MLKAAEMFYNQPQNLQIKISKSIILAAVGYSPTKMRESDLTFFILSFTYGLVQLPITQPALVDKQSHPVVSSSSPHFSLILFVCC